MVWFVSLKQLVRLLLFLTLLENGFCTLVFFSCNKVFVKFAFHCALQLKVYKLHKC